MQRISVSDQKIVSTGTFAVGAVFTTLLVTTAITSGDYTFMVPAVLWPALWFLSVYVVTRLTADARPSNDLAHEVFYADNYLLVPAERLESLTPHLDGSGET